MPGHSPGARIHDGAGTSSGASRWVVARLGAAYIILVGMPVCSAYSLIFAVCSTTSIAMAARRPDRSAASRMRWIVGVRCPASANICCRVNASRTCRPGRARAAIAASTTLTCGSPLDPNPPPT
jgi:hypothetical protein